MSPSRSQSWGSRRGVAITYFAGGLHCYRKALTGRRVIVEGFAFPGEESYLLERAERAAEHAEVRGRFTVTRNDLAWYPGEARTGVRQGR